jgi:predicted methyltransferase
MAAMRSTSVAFRVAALISLGALAPVASACGGGTAASGGNTTPTAAAAPLATVVSATPAPADVDGKIRWAMAGGHRSDRARARDGARHPVETLAFFGLKDDMTVVELWAGSGWYTDLLAPVLHDKGKLRVTSFDNPKGELKDQADKLDQKLAHAPAIYGKVEVLRLTPPDKLALGPDGSADLVLTFRNFHNWMQDGIEDKVLAAAFKVLKPGGTLGVVEHRAHAGTDPKLAKDSGYVPEEFVVKMVEAAGFKLAAKAEINANPKDTKDHPGGVWSLPPSLMHGEKDADIYKAIGESDRMTLKFTKP